jgi:dipeptidyl aminopeptidase/acylaminoacyl peptidase
MTIKKIAPYGSWDSPITADWIVAGSVGLGQICLDGENVYWNEVRPNEKGRSVVRWRDHDGAVADFSAEGMSVRSRAHEYGGGAFVVQGGTLWFSNDADGRIYRQVLGESPRVISPERKWRFADLVRDEHRDRIIAVREAHEGQGYEPANALVAVYDDQRVEVLSEGADFYASPRLSPDGQSLVWLCWRHPNMPWDGCELWYAQLNDKGALVNATLLAGGPDEAIFQPQFSPGGALFFVSDRTGWWNIYQLRNSAVTPVFPLDAEFGLPQWVFGMSTYGFASEHQLVVSYIMDGLSKLAVIDLRSGGFDPVTTPFVDVHGLKAADGRAVFIGGGLKEPPVIAALDAESRKVAVLYRSTESTLDSENVSRANPISFPVGDNETTHGFFYPPQNAAFTGATDENPPLIVKSHGGPTGQTSAAFSVKIQYWTSRGFAVLDLNYRGSTGFGRDYRRRLKGEWGKIDVEDSVAGAQWLSAQEWVDPKKMAISGGSAGGYTTLCALTFQDCFAAGASHYGIGDLTALAKDTHKFESRYLDSLIGPWPETEALYEERSPINHTDQLNCPVIFLQGLEDKVVPPTQAEAMVNALCEKGIAVAYIPFLEEGHGFRQAVNVKRALEAELYFYGQIFNFEPADEIEPVIIENS